MKILMLALATALLAAPAAHADQLFYITDFIHSVSVADVGFRCWSLLR